MTQRAEVLSNPGEALRDLLLTRFPIGNQLSPFDEIDHSLQADGGLVELLHKSAINYMVRRLITGCVAIQRQCKTDGIEEVELNRRMRYYLQEVVSIPSVIREKVFVLLKECLVAIDRPELSRSTVREVRARAARAGTTYCYICGREVTFAVRDLSESGEIEHVWPQAMGGESEAFNLAVACHRCNSVKQTRMGLAHNFDTA